MAQKATAASIYEVLTISKDGKEVPLQGKTINFNYYESLYSPVVTANMMFVDAGGTTPDKKENLTSIKDGLPITALEDVKVKIQTKFGTLDFTKDAFKVTSSPIMDQESNRQTVLLNLVNDKEIKNSEIPIFDRFVGKISDTVTKILLQKLGITMDKIHVESTKNSYGVTGKSPPKVFFTPSLSTLKTISECSKVWGLKNTFRFTYVPFLSALVISWSFLSLGDIRILKSLSLFSRFSLNAPE